MAHDHAHGHEAPSYSLAFAVGVSLNLGFVIVEAIYGWSSHSLALLSDAGHNLSDVFGLLIAWGATRLSRSAPTRRHTYGLRRSSILAAFVNAVVLLIAVGGIAWEALRRLAHPEPLATGVVIAVAAIGVVINTVSALLFVSGSKKDVNLRGAFLHLLADAGVSVGVIVAGILIGVTGWFWLDPAVSLAIGVVIAVGTWGLLRESFDLAMDAVPRGVDSVAVEKYLTGLPGVKGVHDLHIWGMSTTETALTVHLVLPKGKLDDAFLHQIGHAMETRFGIAHTTFQFEEGNASYPCHQAPPEAV